LKRWATSAVWLRLLSENSANKLASTGKGCRQLLSVRHSPLANLTDEACSLISGSTTRRCSETDGFIARDNQFYRESGRDVLELFTRFVRMAHPS
jgi:hypothetical protein